MERKPTGGTHADTAKLFAWVETALGTMGLLLSDALVSHSY